MGLWFQSVGALMLLAAFVVAQCRILPRQSYPCLLLNLIGSAILLVVAYEEQAWAFLLVVGLWASISFWSVLTLASGRGWLTDH